MGGIAFLSLSSLSFQFEIGVLVAKRYLFDNRVPAWPGGGTVAFVNRTQHWYEEDPEHREDGGTPGILQAIRCGLAFKVKVRSISYFYY